MFGVLVRSVLSRTFGDAWWEGGEEIIEPTLPTQQAVYPLGLRFNGVAGLSGAMAI